MEQNLQLKLFRQLFWKEDEEGFSLIELVVVVAVLAVLAAIALPTFTCITRKAKATSALAALKQIQTECAVKKEIEEGTATFVSSNLQGYEIESDGFNSCNGASGTGLIRAIPTDPEQLPTFVLVTSLNQITYSFRDQAGTDFSKCLSMVCTNEIEAPPEPPVPNICISCMAIGCVPYCYYDPNIETPSPPQEL